MKRVPLRAALAGAWLLFACATFAQVPTAAPDAVREAIRDRVDHLRYQQDLNVRGDRIILGTYVAQYFEAQQFRSDWQDPTRVDQLITSIKGMATDGLDPENYHLKTLRSYRNDMNGRPLPAAEQADLEMVAMDALMLATYHLYEGKVDPVKLSSQWNYTPRPVPQDNPLELLSRAVDNGNIAAIFDASRPQHVWYQRGRERLREYREIAAAGGWSSLADGPTMKLGATDARVPALRHRLQITKDMEATPEAYPPSQVFDEALEAGVKHFQERHGLAADGAVGAGTRTALNVPVSDRIDQIRVNLERARWVLHEVQGEFVLVDVAGFYVSYFRNDEPVWTSRVIVGKEGRETPIFKSKITYVVFNPTWTIPPGILVKDKLPVLKRDPGYLKRSRIRVIDGAGREVDPYAVNWSSYSANRLPPYQFVQDPGPDNALGLVKIMFPNPYLVYLHDSPAKALFDQDARLFSSGCIRVQQPFELAELVLNDPVRWNKAAMDAVIASQKTQTVVLAKPVPVLILYWTAQPLPNGQVYFRNDVYNRDPATLAALNSDFRLPSP
ncbi:MAG TPA: L,D-transpeptidase family protein [Steroidobacteraceae bacterium]